MKNPSSLTRPTDRLRIAEPNGNILTCEGFVFELPLRKNPAIKEVKAFGGTLYIVNIDLLLRLQNWLTL